MKKYMVYLVVVLSVLLLLFVFIVAVNRTVVFSASTSDITDCLSGEAISKKYDAIVVLGAGVKEDGTPSHMLEDRLRGAVALYAAGVAPKVVLSGDNSGEHYDEVSAMEKYCINAGIPPEAIVRDDIGFSTYETMDNAIRSLGYRNIMVVTQEYHLYRAIYIAKRMGAEADGFASDYRSYFGQIKRDVREYFARFKDFIKVNISLH